MNPEYEKILKCYDCVRKVTDFEPEVALVLGSGHANDAESMDVVEVIDYKDIEGFPVSTAPGHEGRLVFGYVGKTKVVTMKGRVHFYEGYDIKDVVLPIRLMKMLGANILILTNASGGINPRFNPGDLMLIEDHISTFVPSPLIGENIPELGVRFPDMSYVYDEDLRELARRSAQKLGVRLREGVYIQFKGPNYETPAEIRMAQTLGADAVGMSTACEAIAANHMGMKIMGLSVVSNLAAGISKEALTEEEVLETGERVSGICQKLLIEIISNIDSVR